LASNAGLLDLGFIIAFLAVHLAVVVLFIFLSTVARWGALRAGLYINRGLWWCLPTGELPDCSGKALNFKCCLLPFTAWFTRPIQSS